MRTLTHILNKILAGCCRIILAIMVFCVTWQVIARFIFNAPSTVLDEFTQILFMWMILLDLLAQKLPAASVLTLDCFIQIIITVFAVIFMIYGGNIVVEKAQHVGQISPVLKWPMDKVYWVMPASGLILVWYSVMNIIDNYRKWNSH